MASEDMSKPKPWDADYKPPSAAEAFRADAPLPESALAALDYIDRKDSALQTAERERGEWMDRAISRGKENDELRDEIARLRRSFPVDQLREYDRRRKEAA